MRILSLGKTVSLAIIVAWIVALPAGVRADVVAGTPNPEVFSVIRDPLWIEAAKFLGKKQYNAALEPLDRLEQRLHGNGRRRDLSLELVRLEKVRIKAALGGTESALLELNAMPWPSDPDALLLMRLAYGQCLIQYRRMYSFEIATRSEIDGAQPPDFKAMSSEQLYREILKIYGEVWADRARLATFPRDQFVPILTPNDYPTDVKPTLFESFVSLYGSTLLDTSGWSPRESNDVNSLDLRKLLAGESVSAASTSTHPLAIFAHIKTEAANLNKKDGRLGGSLQQRLELVAGFSSHFVSAKDHREIVSALDAALDDAKGDPWSAMGLAAKADLLIAANRAEIAAAAVALLKVAIKEYPDSIGALRSQDILDRLTEPELRVQSMAVDGPGQKKGLSLTFRNVRKVYFRSYSVNVNEKILKGVDSSIYPNDRDLKRVIEGKPAYAWSIDLPATDDYREHHHVTDLPAHALGSYLVVASTSSNLSELKGGVSGVFTHVSNMILSNRHFGGRTQFQLVDGNRGRPISGATIEVYSVDYKKAHQLVKKGVTDAVGRVDVKLPGQSRPGTYFALARHNRDLAFQEISRYAPGGIGKFSTGSQILLYSDRQIYRPNQKLFWKAVVFRERHGTFRSLGDEEVPVELRDANGEVVHRIVGKSDEYGALHGEFVIPAGRALGSWSLTAGKDSNRRNSIQVEEYKRPTFEISFDPETKPFKLHQPARVSGRANYYFGLPVTEGSVRYRVFRRGRLPSWSRWCFWGFGHLTREQLVESGTTSVDHLGRFSIDFTPDGGDPFSDAKSRDVVTDDHVFNYSIEAELTDPGGETRTATTALAIGRVSAKATVNVDQGFVRENRDFAMTIVRTDLADRPRPGPGTWVMHRLLLPDQPLMPSQTKIPQSVRRRIGPAVREEDLERTRLSDTIDWKDQVLDWAAAEQVGSGTVHNDSDSIEVPMKGLPAGIYRVVYRSVDDFGTPIEASDHILVAAPNSIFPLPLLALVEHSSVREGDTARAFIMSGYSDQTVAVEEFFDDKSIGRDEISGGRILEIPTTNRHGGIGIVASLVRDFELVASQRSIFVPWDNKELSLTWATMRERVKTGSQEEWTLNIAPKLGAAGKKASASVLAFMSDRSLDFFAAQDVQNPLGLFPDRTQVWNWNYSLGWGVAAYFPAERSSWKRRFSGFRDDQLEFFFDRGSGGPGMGRLGFGNGSLTALAATAGGIAESDDIISSEMKMGARAESRSSEVQRAKAEILSPKFGTEVRKNFQETAFWLPDIKADGQGNYRARFKVPDSLTTWNLWAVAVTKDLQSGVLHKTVQSVKDLMVRPYLPRFFREGDKVVVKVVVNNATDRVQAASVTVAVRDGATGRDLGGDFNLHLDTSAVDIDARSSATVQVSMTIPNRLGPVVVDVQARSKGGMLDGEINEVPVVPGRIHLTESRFKVLKDGKPSEKIEFDTLRSDQQDADPAEEGTFITVDGQLFNSVLAALPYLQEYPYQSSDQVLNSFVSTGIVRSLFERYPALAKSAKELAKRSTQIEPWTPVDGNRSIGVEETPWLAVSRGSSSGEERVEPALLRILDDKLATATEEAALAKLVGTQAGSGGFPWFPGGRPSIFMTTYVLHGLAKASEFGVKVPDTMVQAALSYLKREVTLDVKTLANSPGCCAADVTFINYVLSSFTGSSAGNSVFSQDDRKIMADYSFAHWKDLSPLLKSYLALTLSRMERKDDARLVWDSVVDSAKLSDETGTSWVQEDRSWLWYNDTVESEAFALRAGIELGTKRELLDGMVQWLFLNKKLNQWKSTRATAEAIYSLAKYLNKFDMLQKDISVKLRVGDVMKTFEFPAAKVAVRRNQFEISPQAMNTKRGQTIEIEKTGPGIAFVSATRHFSTAGMPRESRGDFMAVERTYFRRVAKNGNIVLEPLRSAVDQISVGDELEVKLAITSKHSMEYVHLRDPRPAGFEPSVVTSGYNCELGICSFREVRDSQNNFFIDTLPQGQYVLTHRMKATTGGTFVAAPAVLQALYAPEFTAYSSGREFVINN